jgi:hypothetical protein
MDLKRCLALPIKPHCISTRDNQPLGNCQKKRHRLIIPCVEILKTIGLINFVVGIVKQIKVLSCSTSGRVKLQQRSIQAIKRTIISIPLESVQIQRISRSHQLLAVNHVVIEVPLLERSVATTGS